MRDSIHPKLLQRLRDQYTLPPFGRHGLGHWARVLENGERLAALTGARLDVVQLFAVFHDACRYGEGMDPRHGGRGAGLARKLCGELFALDAVGLSLLERACARHTHRHSDSDITVATCFDADRLDLPRVRISVDPRRLATQAACDPALIDWAEERAVTGRVDHITWKRFGVKPPRKLS
jgi:uncharacterized protein